MTLLYKAFVSCIHIVKTNKQTHFIRLYVFFICGWNINTFSLLHSHIMHMDEQAKKKKKIVRMARSSLTTSIVVGV